MSDADIEPFMEMYIILEALKKQELTPALAWACERSRALENLGIPHIKSYRGVSTGEFEAFKRLSSFLLFFSNKIV